MPRASHSFHELFPVLGVPGTLAAFLVRRTTESAGPLCGALGCGCCCFLQEHRPTSLHFRVAVAGMCSPEEAVETSRISSGRPAEVRSGGRRPLRRSRTPRLRPATRPRRLRTRQTSPGPIRGLEGGRRAASRGRCAHGCGRRSTGSSRPSRHHPMRQACVAAIVRGNILTERQPGLAQACPGAGRHQTVFAR